MRPLDWLYRPAWLLTATLAAGPVGLVPRPAVAALADAFAGEPGVDLAVELSFRGGYLSPDHALRDEPSPDRVGRERLADAKEEVARGYISRLDDRVVEELVGSLPGLAELERRYRNLLTFRFGDRAGAPDSSGAARVAGARAAEGRAGPADDALTVRLGVDGGGGLLGPRPAVEARLGEWRGRLRYEPTRERFDLDVTRRLSAWIEFGLVGRDSVSGGDSEVAVALTLQF
jgi:hypothetical protein